MTGVPKLLLWGLPGIPEIRPDDDLAEIIVAAVDTAAANDPTLRLAEGDILVVTSKIISKSEGRQIPIAMREAAIEEDTVRIVAERSGPEGTTRIVETPQGLVMAAAGVDTSNVPDDTALRLPIAPDVSALRLCKALRERLGVGLGVIITDTLGRPWRIGQMDLAIGAAGVRLLDDFRGRHDANGRPMTASIAALGDEIAAAADLVKGKALRVPVAIIRGLGNLVGDLDLPGSRVLHRPYAEDMFRLGSDEAYRLGYEAAVAEMQTGGKKAQW